MKNSFRTSFTGMAIKPLQETAPQGQPSLMRVEVQYENTDQQEPELISLSVLVKAGDRSFVEVQRDAIARAVEILQQTGSWSNPDPLLK